ncbi:hypothetical protein [Sphingobium estronivorans]|uniref:hypothetical protein n=1 Tax=Sphingobium estronivorans TaxID=1577690 RepID=UPI0013C2BD15|nr:hypothetical protein [Sphingobium estronivorans]
MKSLADRSFFRVFDLLVASAQPNGSIKRPTWSIADTEWVRERHSYAGPNHSFTMETIQVRRTTAPRWTLLVVKEFWWIESQEKPLRDLRWAKLIQGNSQEALKWFRLRETR